MANPEHLAKLKEGVEVWNKWREENPDLRPDISGVELNVENLSGINLKGAMLIWSRLSGCNLDEADLRLSNLQEAFLVGTDLKAAKLNHADLRWANCSLAFMAGADLTFADLGGVNFTETDLEKTNFDSASISDTVFANVDLSNVKGLPTIRHHGPSTIGLDTLYRSQGKIPEVFLRGCGVPDQMIEYARSLIATPIQYYSCFISYSHKDEEFSHYLWERLQANNVRCWFAPHDMKIGDKIRSTIDESIRIYDKLLLILSEHSVKSDWVEHEVEHALDRERLEKKNILFPVRLDEAIMDSSTGWAGNVKRQRHIGDFSRWKDHDAYKKSFDRLLRDLKSEK